MAHSGVNLDRHQGYGRRQEGIEGAQIQVPIHRHSLMILVRTRWRIGCLITEEIDHNLSATSVVLLDISVMSVIYYHNLAKRETYPPLHNYSISTK